MTETECAKASETWLKVNVALASGLLSCSVHAQRPHCAYVQACWEITAHVKFTGGRRAGAHRAMQLRRVCQLS